MNYHQCEWCEKLAKIKFSSLGGRYTRYSCSGHADRVRRLMSNDGVDEWSEKISEVPFEIDDSQNKELVQPDPLGKTK